MCIHKMWDNGIKILTLSKRLFQRTQKNGNDKLLVNKIVDKLNAF